MFCVIYLTPSKSIRATCMTFSCSDQSRKMPKTDFFFRKRQITFVAWYMNKRVITLLSLVQEVPQCGSTLWHRQADYNRHPFHQSVSLRHIQPKDWSMNIPTIYLQTNTPSFNKLEDRFCCRIFEITEQTNKSMFQYHPYRAVTVSWKLKRKTFCCLKIAWGTSIEF